jgi:transposase
MQNNSELYIGIDVHKKSWSVNLRTDLFDHKTFSMDPDVWQLIRYVDRHFAGYKVKCCYEACCCGYSAYHQLCKAGWEVLVVNPPDVPIVNKQQQNKSDKVDCRHLCKQLQAGQLRGIYVPDEKQEQLRSLFRQRNNLTRALRRIKCHIKGELLYYNIEVPKQYDNNNWSKGFIAWIEKQEWKYETGRESLQSKLRQLHFSYYEWLGVSNTLRSYVRKHYRKDYYLLRSVPGIGPLTAIGILAELGDVRRFRSLDRLASYVGLIPSVYSSGEILQTRGMTPRSKHLLRSYLIEASWTAVRTDMVLQEYYRSHSGKPANKIIVKVARKLLNRIWYVIRNEVYYQSNIKQ